MELNNLEKKYGLKAKIYTKVEFFNPSSSVKVCVAKIMVEEVIKQGLVNKDTVLVEPTNGNLSHLVVTFKVKW